MTDRVVFGRRAGMVLASIVSMLVIVGCQSNRAASDGMTSLERVSAAYEQGDYSTAYGGAIRAYADLPVGPARDQAAYFAGLSAYQLQNYDYARRYLTPLVSHVDLDLAGPAAATLGLVELDSNRPHAAIPHLEIATKMLTGNEKAQAQYYLSSAYAKTGRPSDARANLIVARQSVTDNSLRTTINDELTVSGFTLQAGVFRDRRNAANRADSLQSTVRSLGLGQTHIHETRDAQGSMYVVQIGQFQSYETARRAASRLGTPVIIKPLSTVGIADASRPSR